MFKNIVRIIDASSVINIFIGIKIVILDSSIEVTILLVEIGVDILCSIWVIVVCVIVLCVKTFIVWVMESLMVSQIMIVLFDVVC